MWYVLVDWVKIKILFYNIGYKKYLCIDVFGELVDFLDWYFDRNNDMVIV